MEQACSSSAVAEPLYPEQQEQLLAATGMLMQMQQAQELEQSQQRIKLRGPSSMVAEVLEWAESSERLLESERWAESYSSWAESSGEELIASIKSVAASLYNASPASPSSPTPAGSARARVAVEGELVRSPMDLADTSSVSRAPSSCDGDASDREAMAYGYTADVPAAHAALAMAYGYTADVPSTPEPARRNPPTPPPVAAPAGAAAASTTAPGAAPSAADTVAAPGMAAAPPAVALPLHFQHGFASISVASEPTLALPRVHCVGHKAAMTDDAMWAFLSSLEQARWAVPPARTDRSPPHLAPRTSHLAPCTSHLAPRTSHLASRTSHLAPRTSHLAPRTSHLTPHTSHLTPPTSHLTPPVPLHLTPRTS